MAEFKVVAVLWQDHMQVTRSSIPTDPDLALSHPTLTIGALLKKSKKSVIILSDLERYADRDEANYMIILRSDILGIKEYGVITIDNLRFAP